MPNDKDVAMGGQDTMDFSEHLVGTLSRVQAVQHHDHVNRLALKRQFIVDGNNAGLVVTRLLRYHADNPPNPRHLGDGNTDIGSDYDQVIAKPLVENNAHVSHELIA